MTRKDFVKTLCVAPLCARAYAQGALTDRSVPMPSARFGTASPSSVGLDDAVAEKMTAYLQSQIDAKVIPGAAVCAVRHGKVFVEKSLGTYQDRDRMNVPYDGAAVHPFFSVSKMVSATAVVMAWQDGLIDIDLPVVHYLPEFGQGGKEKITIRHLLTHSAGIPKAPPNLSGDSEAHWDQAIDAICRMPIQWPAGSQTKYHGLTGLLIAAEIVRRAEGRKTWNEICGERVFRPIGLDTFTFEGPNLARPYAIIPQSTGEMTWQRTATIHNGLPAAGCKGSIADLLQFLKFQSGGGVWNKRHLLKKKYWTEMHTLQFPGKAAPTRAVPGFDNWGFGMMIKGSNPKPGGLGWFGIDYPLATPHPRLFSHVGVSEIMACGDPDTDIQIVFISTDNPVTKEKATELRNRVTQIIFNAIRANPA